VLEQLFFPRKVRRIRRCWLAADIELYLAWLRQRGRPHARSAQGETVSTNSMRRVFGRLCREVGVGASDSGAPPRVHDLRHSFAVATLLHWYEAGINPSGNSFISRRSSVIRRSRRRPST
jgi:integrase